MIAVPIVPIAGHALGGMDESKFTDSNIEELMYTLKVVNLYWLVVSTHLKNISQIGNLPQVGMKIKNVWNHHPVYFVVTCI